MFKWILRVLYAVLVVIVGFQMYATATNNKNQEFFKKEVLSTYEEGNIDDIVSKSMTAWQSTNYIEKPLYHFSSSEETDYTFDIGIYSFKVGRKDEVRYGFMIYVYNLEVKNLENKLDDYSAYEKNPGLLGLNVLIMGQESNSFIEENLAIVFDGKELKGNVFGPIYLNTGDENYFSYRIDQSSEKKMNQVKTISFSIVDATKETNGRKLNKFAEITANNDLEDKYIDDTMALGDREYLNTNKFNGDASYYKDINETYNGTSDSVATVDTTVLSKYNYVVTRTMLLYVGAIILSTFLLFFFKPLMEKLRTKKELKNKEEVKQAK
ncbi:hypothetical protein [Haploplasma axanthum]|uniref:Uncharacterized protein n=1 Tax=Haploplasma axanthum TaxID=29552 RepID=A0A449BFL2_HAPAX|nr:hypothetical protein [Haploplasma axanthum]VEU81100.1 Uncharacterised protein [Haploplasma axanthum]